MSIKWPRCPATKARQLKNGRDYNPKHPFIGEFQGQNLWNYQQPWQLGQPYDKLAVEIIYHWECGTICPLAHLITSLFMLFLIANIAAATLYTALGIYLARQLLQQRTLNLPTFLAGVAVALALHAVGIYGVSVKPDGIQLSFFTVSSQIFWVINAIVLLSSLKKALHNLFIFLLPCSALAIVTTLVSHTQSTILQLNYTLASHVILSILAYSLLTIATLQAILLSYALVCNIYATYHHCKPWKRFCSSSF